MVDLESLTGYVESKSGLFVPNRIEESAPVNPNHNERRRITAQIKRFTRQQKRLKMRKEKNA